MDVGLAVTLAPVFADKPVDGLHEYVLPPLAVSDTELPLQMVELVGEIEMVGGVPPVTVKLLVAVHPPASLTVTV